MIEFINRIKERIFVYNIGNATVKAILKGGRHVESRALFDMQKQILPIDFSTLPQSKLYRITHRYELDVGRGENPPPEFSYEWFYRHTDFDGKVCLGWVNFTDPSIPRLLLRGLKPTQYEIETVLLDSPNFDRFVMVSDVHGAKVNIIPFRLDIIH